MQGIREGMTTPSIEWRRRFRSSALRFPVLASSSGEVIDGHLRLKAAQKLGMTEIPVIICDDWTEAQVKAFRLLVNRSVTWADWDPELLSLEMLDLRNLDYDIDLTGFDTHEIDELLLAQSDDPHEDDAPAAPDNPVSRAGDLWLCGKHRMLSGDATSPEAVARLLVDRKPRLMITDPPYGIELDSEWRDRAGLNGCGPAEKSYMKHRTAGHNETTISGDTRADWSEAFELVPSLEAAYVWHASKFTREVLDGLLRIGFLHHQQIIWDTVGPCSRARIIGSNMSLAGTSARRMHRGSGRPAKTPRCGHPHRRSSSWAARARTSSITPRRSLSS
jgi:hypothetical protein